MESSDDQHVVGARLICLVDVTSRPPRFRGRVVAVEGHVHRWLVAHSMTVLRLTMGLVFLGFGALKLVPGASPAQDLVITTTRILSLGTVPDRTALILTAVLECVIGALLIIDLGRRLALYLLAAELLGILSPTVLLASRLFPGPQHFPTLEAQYVLKDIVLVGAAMVLATRFRGAVIVRPSVVRSFVWPDNAGRSRLPLPVVQKIPASGGQRSAPDESSPDSGGE